MSIYKPFDRHLSLKSYYGSADKEAVMALDGDRLDQQVFPFDQQRIDHFNDGASTYITMSGLYSRLSRDLAMDIQNPRQELGKNPSDMKVMDVIPNLTPMQPDISVEADYEASNALKLYKEAKQHFKSQNNLFIDGKAIGDQKVDTYGSKPIHSLGGLEMFSHEGNAAGLSLNRLHTDQDDAYLNSVDSVSAF